MKKMKKVLALTACAAMLVTASVMGTLAYLTANDSVTNTFTIGNVVISMDESNVDAYGQPTSGKTETGNEYKLIPGHTYTKDPTIYVNADSEACWLFVKIENGLGDKGTINGLDTNGWTQIDSGEYWAYAGATVGGGAKVKVFDSFTFASDVVNLSSYSGKNIVVTAYAIQADNLNSWQDAWTALANQDDNIPDVNVTP